MAVSDRLPAARVLGPVVDGDLVPDYPADVLRRGEGAPLPMIIGTNADEGTLFQRIRGIRATPAGKAWSRASSVSGDGVRSTAVAFSSSQRRCFVPGRGTTKSRRDRSQARASCAGVQPSRTASVRRVSRRRRLPEWSRSCSDTGAFRHAFVTLHSPTKPNNPRYLRMFEDPKPSTTIRGLARVSY